MWNIMLLYRELDKAHTYVLQNNNKTVLRLSPG